MPEETHDEELLEPEVAETDEAPAAAEVVAETAAEAAAEVPVKKTTRKSTSKSGSKTSEQKAAGSRSTAKKSDDAKPAPKKTTARKTTKAASQASDADEPESDKPEADKPEADEQEQHSATKARREAERASADDEAFDEFDELDDFMVPEDREVAEGKAKPDKVGKDVYAAGHSEYSPRKAEATRSNLPLIVTPVLVVLIVAGLLFGLGKAGIVQLPAGCSSSTLLGGNGLGTGTQAEVDPNAVAATIGDYQIMEADVTLVAESSRIDSSTGEPYSDADWAGLLKTYDMTPESLREAIIRQQFALPELVLAEAEAAGIYPDDAAVDAALEEQKAYATDVTWEELLTSYGFKDEASFRRYLEYQDVTEDLLAVKVQAVTPSDDELKAYILENADYYVGKRASVIYFPYGEGYDDYDTAKAKADEALARIKAGEDFGTVADAYNTDDVPVEAGGDIGWGAESYMPTEVGTVLSALPIGSYSDIIDTTTALFIVKSTDEFKLPADGSVDLAAVPEEIKTELGDELASNDLYAQQQAYMDELSHSELLVINPMPAGLPYDVDMSLADVQITDVSVGSGDVVETGDTISVYYTGYLEDGTVFDSTDATATAFSFTVGNGEVITGWEEGVLGMQVGGVRRLVIPPALAYGSYGTSDGTIPANATLTFDIELVSIQKAAS
ncbi:MAG: FKBP-type peptidyl-prolyl cis-trans isomerase [Coriobacteriales bacterium]|jgi:parvulin-like peptidyl-prolyl isomerase|nr:FKBP-type peptidyl-prolyl cis-trans isomerase [Coriobacteriales bacterium]